VIGPLRKPRSPVAGIWPRVARMRTSLGAAVVRTLRSEDAASSAEARSEIFERFDSQSSVPSFAANVA
jgi:hypothetical protein